MSDGSRRLGLTLMCSVITKVDLGAAARVFEGGPGAEFGDIALGQESPMSHETMGSAAI